MANLRSLSQIMFVYTNDHREDFLNPFRVELGETQPSASTPWTDAVGIGDTSNALRWRFASSVSAKSARMVSKAPMKTAGVLRGVRANGD